MLYCAHVCFKASDLCSLVLTSIISLFADFTEESFYKSKRQIPGRDNAIDPGGPNGCRRNGGGPHQV